MFLTAFALDSNDRGAVVGSPDVADIGLTKFVSAEAGQ
jgi:hypothetical protein